jgi:hypothetical protein
MVLAIDVSNVAESIAQRRPDLWPSRTGAYHSDESFQSAGFRYSEHSEQIIQKMAVFLQCFQPALHNKFAPTIVVFIFDTFSVARKA